MGFLRWLGIAAVVMVLPELAVEASAAPVGVRMAVKGEVDRIAAEEGVDKRLVEAVVEMESAYNPWAVSGKGAVGVMQLSVGHNQAVKHDSDSILTDPRYTSSLSEDAGPLGDK